MRKERVGDGSSNIQFIMTRTTIQRLLKIASATAITIIIVFYAIWRSLNYTRGPEINIFTPSDNFAATTSTITIIGQVERVNSLSLNGKIISVDEQGNFSETIIVFPGMNIITLEAIDRFQRGAKKQLKIVGL